MNRQKFPYLKELPILKVFKIFNRIFFITVVIFIAVFISWLQLRYGMAEVLWNILYR